MADTRKYVQGQDWTLNGSGCGLSDTSIVLSSMLFPDNETQVVTADIGSLAYGVVEPETPREENVSFTGITQNANGTATLTGVTRGLGFSSPYAADASLRQSHAGSSVFRITNSAPFYADFANKENDETVSGAWTFAQNVSVPLVPVDNADAASKEYVDGTATAGAPNANPTTKGIVQLATQAQNNAGTSVGSTGASLVATPDVNASSVQNSSWTYAEDAGVSDAYAVTLAPAPAGYADGLEITFVPNTSCTGASTLNPNGLGPITIKKCVNGVISDTESNDILATYPVTVVKKGLIFLMTSPPATQLDAAVSYEAQQFFSTTAITGAQATTLSAGTSSNADSLHTHSSLVTSFNGSAVIEGLDTLNDTNYETTATGFSDAPSDLLAVGTASVTDATVGVVKIEMSPDVGSAPFVPVSPAAVDIADSTPVVNGVLYIADDLWTSNSSDASIAKNGASVTVSGTVRNGPLGYAADTSSLLVLYSTTKVAKFSGIAGTTITNLNADVTFDAAVTATVGFLYDDSNNEYICVDTTANLVRKISSSGATQATAPYTITDASVRGVCMVANRVYLAVAWDMSLGAATAGGLGWSLVPTTMKRTGT